VHQQLAVGAKHVQQADIAGGERTAFLTAELIALEESWQIGAIVLLDSRVAIDLVQEFLQLIEAHGDRSAVLTTPQAPQRGMWWAPRLTQTFFGSRNTS